MSVRLLERYVKSKRAGAYWGAKAGFSTCSVLVASSMAARIGVPPEIAMSTRPFQRFCWKDP